jgi:hypothetical protein
MRYRPTPGLMPPWQNPHVDSCRACAGFTALVLFASTSRMDTLPGLGVLMVCGADDGRRTRGRTAVIGAARSKGRQRGQHHAQSCGEERHCLQRRRCVSSHRPYLRRVSGVTYVHDACQSGAAPRLRKCCDCGPARVWRRSVRRAGCPASPGELPRRLVRLRPVLRRRLASL